jgi:hypothetical protein
MAWFLKLKVMFGAVAVALNAANIECHENDEY